MVRSIKKAPANRGGVWGFLIIRAYLEFLTYPQDCLPVDNFSDFPHQRINHLLLKPFLLLTTRRMSGTAAANPFAIFSGCQF